MFYQGTWAEVAWGTEEKQLSKYISSGEAQFPQAYLLLVCNPAVLCQENPAQSTRHAGVGGGRGVGGHAKGPLPA